jgi:C-terminal processing protease CtpA/Prc
MLTTQTEKTFLLGSALLLTCFVGAICTFRGAAPVASDQKTMSSGQRDEVEDWVRQISDALRDDYYDRTFHGIDFKVRSAEAEDRVKKVATLSDAMGVIAWMLEGLNDSHTFFLPPARPYQIEHGWSLGMVGEKCYIIAVKPGSDAEAQGIHSGDEVISLEGFPVNRDNLWKLQQRHGSASPVFPRRKI